MASIVIRIGASRSLAPWMTSSGPNGTPSSLSRCWKWLISMMPLRAVIPSTVKKPTSEPIESTPPVDVGADQAADQGDGQRDQVEHRRRASS